MKLNYILMAGLILVSISGIASAANDSIQLYDAQDKQNVIDQIEKVNMGNVFAMLDLMTAIMLPVTGIILFGMLIYGKVAGKPDFYKQALSALFMVMLVCVLIQIFFSWTSDLTPSIQSIDF